MITEEKHSSLFCKFGVTGFGPYQDYKGNINITTVGKNYGEFLI